MPTETEQPHPQRLNSMVKLHVCRRGDLLEVVFYLYNCNLSHSGMTIWCTCIALTFDTLLCLGCEGCCTFGAAAGDQG